MALTMGTSIGGGEMPFLVASLACRESGLSRNVLLPRRGLYLSSFVSDLNLSPCGVL